MFGALGALVGQSSHGPQMGLYRLGCFRSCRVGMTSCPRLPCRVDMTSEATAARDAATAPTTFSLRPQHSDDPGALLVFRFTKDRGGWGEGGGCSVRWAGWAAAPAR